MRLSFRLALLAGFFLCLFQTVDSFAQTDSIVRRAAFDIGSAAIKCTIADMDTATGRIVKIVETLSEKVDFAEDLARSYDSNLSHEIMDTGITALEKIKETAVELNTQEFSAAGGTVFRTARNGRAYFVRIKNETGIPSRIVSEQQAAMLSYHAVRQALNDSSRDLLVWDIGGGSMQMTVRRLDGGLLFYLDPMASVSFKNVVIGTIQGKNVNTVSSPNPVNEEEAAMALNNIKTHALTSVPPLITARLRRANMLVAGIGGVHYYGIPELLGGRNETYTREEVAAALNTWTNREDEEFDSEYASTRLTNLILVLGYMDALGIKKIHPLKIDQSNGLLAAPEFW